MENEYTHTGKIKNSKGKYDNVKCKVGGFNLNNETIFYFVTDDSGYGRCKESELKNLKPICKHDEEYFCLRCQHLGVNTPDKLYICGGCCHETNDPTKPCLYQSGKGQDGWKVEGVNRSEPFRIFSVYPDGAVTVTDVKGNDITEEYRKIQIQKEVEQIIDWRIMPTEGTTITPDDDIIDTKIEWSETDSGEGSVLELLIKDIKTLPNNDIAKLYKYVRRHLIANIEGLTDPLDYKTLTIKAEKLKKVIYNCCEGIYTDDDNKEIDIIDPSMLHKQLIDLIKSAGCEVV